MKNKPSSGTGMLSAAGQSKTIAIAPPPSGANKIRSPLPPPPNDLAISQKTSSSPRIALKGPKESSRQSIDPLSNLSQLQVFHFVPFITLPTYVALCILLNRKSTPEIIC